VAANPIEHGGLFPTMREARIRRDLIAGELAAGRNPADALRGMAERPKTRTFAEWAKAWKESRVDVSDSTLTGHHNHLLRLEPTFGERDPGTLKVDRVWRRSVWSPRWGRKEASMRPKLAVTVLIIAVAALIAVPAATPAGAGAETYLQTFHNVTEVSTDLNPLHRRSGDTDAHVQRRLPRHRAHVGHRCRHILGDRNAHRHVFVRPLR
jgi:hypothetical protein